MKKTIAKTLLVACAAMSFSSHAAITPGGISKSTWTITNPPTNGVSEITFPIRVNEAPVAKGYYFAQQFRVVGANLGYIGIQPLATSEKHAQLIFSVFGSGTKPISSNCSSGADGGSGVSCSAFFSNFVRGQLYYFNVKQDSGDKSIWHGSMSDGTNETQIGTWQITGSTKGINKTEVGWIEHFKSLDSCAKLPKISVQYHQPRITGYKTTITGPTEYGKCKGSSNFAGFNTDRWMATHVLGFSN